MHSHNLVWIFKQIPLQLPRNEVKLRIEWGLFVGCLGMAGAAGRIWIYYLTPEGTREKKSLLLGLCLNRPEVGGKFLGQEKARIGIIQVLEKQRLRG